MAMIKEEIIKVIDEAQETQIKITAQRIEVLQEIQEIVKTVHPSDVEKLVITYALSSQMATSLKEELEKITKHRIEVSKLKLKMGY